MIDSSSDKDTFGNFSGTSGEGGSDDAARCFFEGCTTVVSSAHLGMPTSLAAEEAWLDIAREPKHPQKGDLFLISFLSRPIIELSIHSR